MTEYMTTFKKELKEKKTTYREMIDFCCDNLVLNNDIIEFYNKTEWDLEVYNGCDWEEDGEPVEVFQYYIVGPQDAERLAEYTDEIVYYLPQIDMYVLGVTHWGTAWDGVSANWK